jgi:CubicO group peptidase (beta-lactamase class C family)
MMQNERISTSRSAEMSRPSRFAWGVFASILAAAASAESPAPSVQNQLQARARRLVTEGRTDGLSIAMIRCGQIKFLPLGIADRRTRRPVTADTVFEIGSVSKSLTALLLAQAVVDGRARLEDDVRRYLPEPYPNLQWSDGTPITLGQLADTTSGLPDYLPDPAPLAKLPADRQVFAASDLLRAYSNQDFLRDLHGIQLLARPGSASRHSNVAAQLLGVLLARVFEQPFQAALARHIERPAGMGSGVATVPGGNAAVGYDNLHRAMPAFTGESIMPAGGLRYNARDMARYLMLQLQSNDRAVALSQRVRFSDTPDRQLALTWVISTEGGLQKYRMSGGTFGSSSYVEFYPALQYGVVMMANRVAPDMQDELQGVAEAALAAGGRNLSACPARK